MCALNKVKGMIDFMNNVGEKYLPIGTVVMLKEGKKRIMITGFCSIPNNDKNKMYDYSGCMYPEGLLSSEQTALFDHEQIDEVYHLGLQDEEERKFKKFLNYYINEETINNRNVADSNSGITTTNNVNTVNTTDINII